MILQHGCMGMRLCTTAGISKAGLPHSRNWPCNLGCSRTPKAQQVGFQRQLAPQLALPLSCSLSAGAFEAMTQTFPSVDSLKAVLFDVDGTLVDSDPLHYVAFREMLQEVGFNGGVPITEGFFSQHISGKHNLEIGLELFPEWDQEWRDKFLDDKEALFRRMAAVKLAPVIGLHQLTDWVRKRGLRRAAVTNAPRVNAEQMIAAVGLTDFFELLVIGSECKRGKPFPDPYLKALEYFKISPEHAFAIEDSPSGLKAAVSAGLPVVGVITGNPGPVLLAAGATFLIKNYEDPALWRALE